MQRPAKAYTLAGDRVRLPELPPYGALSELVKEHVWKACVPQGTLGSSPRRSAIRRVSAVGVRNCPESSRPWQHDPWVRLPHPPPSLDGIAVGMRKRLESAWSQRCGSGVRFPRHPPHGDHSTTVSASGCGPGHRGSTPRGHTMRPRSSTDERRPPKSQTCWFESSRGHHMRVSTNGRVGDQQSPNPGSTPGTRTIDWGLAQRLGQLPYKRQTRVRLPHPQPDFLRMS